MLTETVRIGRKNVLHLPTSVVRALGVREGDKVQLTVDGGTIRMEIISDDPLKLALEGRKSAKINPDEVEAISLKEQSRHSRSSA